MKRPHLPLSVKNIAHHTGAAIKISKGKLWLQSLQVEPRFQTLKMTSAFNFQTGLNYMLITKMSGFREYFHAGLIHLRLGESDEGTTQTTDTLVDWSPDGLCMDFVCLEEP